MKGFPAKLRSQVRRPEKEGITYAFGPDQVAPFFEVFARHMRDLGTPLLIHQPSYSMFDRWIEGELLDTLEELGIGCIAFCPLAQGLLTDKYLGGIPEGSRAAKAHGFLKREHVTEEKVGKVRQLRDIASARATATAT